MKRFQDIIIPCSKSEAKKFFLKLNTTVKGFNGRKWQVYEEAMKRLQSEGSYKKDLFLCINRMTENHTPDAMVAILFSEQDNHTGSRIWVSNIVPCQVNELSYDAYNEIINEFYVDIIQPNLSDNLSNGIITSDSFTGQNCMDIQSWKKLETFSHLANMTSLHFYDNQRWWDFIISMYNKNTKLDAHTLFRILAEELKWPTDRAHELSGRYEREIQLLEYYDTNKK